MKKIVALVLCSLFIATTAHSRVIKWPENKRIPRTLKMPKTCKVVKYVKNGSEKSYHLECKKGLSKRMRGWVFLQKTRSERMREREWTSRRGNWRLLEESTCRLKTCKADRVIIYNIVGC